MDFKNVFTLCLIFCSFLLEANSADPKSSSQISEEVIRRELERYASIKEAAQAENLDVTVIFSHTTTNENGTRIQHDSVQFRPILFKHNPGGPQVPENVDETKLKEIFDFAAKANMSTVASRETYSQDGSLQSKLVYAEDIKIFYNHDHSDIIITDQDHGDDEDQFENFINMLKQYELPVMVQKTLYNDKGETLKVDTMEHKPRKVRIEDGNMQNKRKLFVAEALKRAFSMKDDGNDRVTLLCRVLGAQYPKFTWQAVIGDGPHFLRSDEWVYMVLEGQAYTIVANKK